VPMRDPAPIQVLASRLRCSACDISEPVLGHSGVNLGEFPGDEALEDLVGSTAAGASPNRSRVVLSTPTSDE
jgi:hypothetical protein